jgi:HupE/UreJ protein
LAKAEALRAKAEGGSHKRRDLVASAFRRKKSAATFLLALSMVAVAWAHDIPSDITVQAFVKPDGPRLRVLVRAPLKAMRDVQFPLRGPGFLDLGKAQSLLGDAAMLWIAGSLDLYEGDVNLGAPSVAHARVSLPSDRSFASYEEALAYVSGPALSNGTDIPWDQAMLDVLFVYPIASDRSVFSIRPSLARLGLRVVTVLRFIPPGGTVRAFEYTGDPGLVRLDPRWHQAAARFVRLGFVHILDGTDHLLFLLCLVIPFRRPRELILTVTAFTAGHSVTLIASAWNAGPNGLWFPPLVETLIAASIVYMALENIVLAARDAGPSPGLGQRRWILAFAFGLVHGFGFSFALRESLQFAGSHLLTSLLSFNAGVELGQLLVLALMVPALLAFRFVVAERVGAILLSALVAHTAWHWTADRWGRLHRFAWPAFDAATLAVLVRLLMVLAVAGAVAWMIGGLLAARETRAHHSRE